MKKENFRMADLALKGAGLACAFGSVWFAAHTLTHQGGAPRVNAIEDFAIFAQPNRLHAVEAAVRAQAMEGEALKSGRSITIDMTPVGVTRPGSRQPGAPRRDLRILELSGEGALIETEEGYRRVKVGDEIPDIGKIISIRSMGHYWVLAASLRSVVQEVPLMEKTAGRP
jgi:hypothetical protein